MKIHCNPKLKTLSRELRKKGTLGEVLLWKALKGRKIRGYQFMRQKPIGDYIVDFFCSKLKLVIELDGISHIDKAERDRIRQQKLESLGLSVVRFCEWDIKKDVRNVVQGIVNWIEKYENEKKGTSTDESTDTGLSACKNTTP